MPVKARGESACDEAGPRLWSLLIRTVPRTPSRAAAALEQAIDVPHRLYRWDRARGQNSPYTAFIALVNRLMVTEESVSALAEACSSGRPVTVLPLERQPGAGPVGRLGDSGQAVLAKLADAGIVRPPRRIDAVHWELACLGLARWAEGALQVIGPPTGAHDPAVRAAERVRWLMSRTGPVDGGARRYTTCEYAGGVGMRPPAPTHR